MATPETQGLDHPGVADPPVAFPGASWRWAWAWTKRGWPVWLVAGTTVANGLLSILQVVLLRFPDHPRFFSVLLPFGLHHWSRSLTLVFGFALVYLSFNLVQRKRAAWWLAAVISILAVLAHLGRVQNQWHLALGPAVGLAVLLVFRRRFSVRSEPRSMVQGLALMALSLMLALTYGVLGFWRLDRQDFGLEFNAADALVRTLRAFILVGNGDLMPQTRHARWFLESLGVLGISAGLFAAYSLFRPLAYRSRTLPRERQLVQDILSQHGRSSLDFFKLWPDKSYFFSPNHHCVIAYNVAWSVAVSLGDPVGPEEEIAETTRAFIRYCSDNGWAVAFHQVLPGLVPMYRGLGLRVVKVGEEAVIDLNRFGAVTAERKEFRRIQRKFGADGYVLHHHVPPHPPELLQEVEEVSSEWLCVPGRRERGFTLGRFERPYVGRTPLFVLRDPAGQGIAFVNQIPAYSEGEATIDLMRHRLSIPNGAMDYLFMALMLALKEQGYQRFNLGLAPFAGMGDRPGASIEERAMHQFFEHLNRFFSYKGLRNYKAKFDPVWEERFLVFQGGPPALVRVGIAMTRITEG